MKKIAIIQARMGSTRLPQKVLLDLAGKPVIERVFERVARATLVDEIWLATTVRPDDDVLANWAKRRNYCCFRGSEDDVLDRFYKAAKTAAADVIIRVTGDCPLIDTAIIDIVIKEYTEKLPDYICNTNPPTFPDGLDVEVFSFAVLKKAWQEAGLKSEREHVTSYIWKHPEIFKLRNVANDTDLSANRWTLDTKEDYDFISQIFKQLERKKIFGTMAEILNIVRNNPQWQEFNHHIERNEGYTKSLNEDKIYGKQ